MREPITIVRVKYPTLAPLEADFVMHDKMVNVYIPLSYADKTPTFEVNERIIITWYDESTRHTKAKVLSITQEDLMSDLPLTEENSYEKQLDSGRWYTLILSLSLDDIQGNLRHYPRLIGGIDLAYTPVNENDSIEAWLEGEIKSATAPLQKPIDSFMNFSVNGLKFECSTTLNESTLLLCEIGLSSEQQRWRSLAKVVRVWEEVNYKSVAIHFISPPTELTEKLSEFTLKIQRVSEFT
jgi:hypothetical protein